MLGFVAPDDLPAAWPFVEAGCNKILRKAERVGCKQWWKPPDVLERLTRCQAFLFVEPGEGFLVIEEVWEPNGIKFLRVWLGWFKPGAAKKRREELVHFLDGLKTSSESAWVQFESPFDGWIAIEPQFKRYMTIWRRY